MADLPPERELNPYLQSGIEQQPSQQGGTVPWSFGGVTVQVPLWVVQAANDPASQMYYKAKDTLTGLMESGGIGRSSVGPQGQKGELQPSHKEGSIQSAQLAGNEGLPSGVAAWTQGAVGVTGEQRSYPTPTPSQKGELQSSVRIQYNPIDAATGLVKNYYVPEGSYAQQQLQNIKLGKSESGELAFYEKLGRNPAGFQRLVQNPATGELEAFELIGGGGRAAAQSGMFGYAAATPAVYGRGQVQQGMAGLVTPAVMAPGLEKSGLTGAEVLRIVEGGNLKQYDTRDKLSRLGAEAYGGMVQRIDQRTLGSITYENAENRAWWNEARYANPQAANMGKAELPGANIPWSVGERTPAIFFMDQFTRGAENAPALSVKSFEAYIPTEDITGRGAGQVSSGGGGSIGGAPVSPTPAVGPDVYVMGPDKRMYLDTDIPWGNTSAVSGRLIGSKVVAACAKITDNANAMVAGTEGIGKGTGAAMTVWELTPENSGLSAGQIAMIQWGATEGQTRANEFFAPPKPFVSKSEPAKAIPPVEPIGVIGGYERAVFDLGFVNIIDAMKGPAGKAAAIVVPGAAGFVWHAEFVAGSAGAQKQGEYEYGGYSVVSERAGQWLQEVTGFNAARLETYAAKPETGFIETFGASAGATVLRNPGQLPVAAAQGVILSPLFEGIGVSSAFAGARIGGKISATAGVTAAKVAERVIPTAIFGGMVAYGVTNKFEDFSAKGMTMRAGAMAPSTIAMITPIIIMPRIGENLTWRAINKAAKTPEEQSMVNSLKDIQSLTKGVDTGIRHPPKFEEIKYVGEEGAGPLGKVLKEEPGIVFGGTTMQTQMKAKEIPRQTADIDWMVYKSGEGVERLAEKTAAKMGEPFRAEGNLVVREIPGQEHAPHAVDIHSYMERGGEYTPPFKMELPVSKVVTIKGISYEPLYLQETRKVSAALGIRTEEGWEFFPESEAHRLVKDIGDVPAVGRAFIEPLQKQHDLLAPIRGSKAVRLEKAITEYEQNPLVRGYIEEYHRMYAGKEILTTERAAPPQMTSQYYATLGAPSMYIGVSKFVGSPPSMAPSPRYSIPSSIPPSSIRRSSVLPSVPSIISYSPSPSKASSMRSSLAPSTPGYPSYLSVPSLSTGRTPSPPSTKAPSSRISTPPYSPPYTPPSRGPSTPSYTPPSSPPYSPPYRLPPPSSPPPIPVIFPGGGGGAGPGYRGKRTWVNVHPVGADILGATRGNVFRLPEPMPTKKGKKKKTKPWFPEF